MIYVLSDIHGQKRRFDSIMKQIDLQPEDTLYILGDVIDRNPHGIQILRQIMKMPNVKMLLGNHEHMMLDALYFHQDEYEFGWQYRQEKRLSLWYRNGGDVTHQYLKHIGCRGQYYSLRKVNSQRLRKRQQRTRLSSASTVVYLLWRNSR